MSDPLTQAVDYLRSRLTSRPSLGMVLGSGLGQVAERRPVTMAIPYAEIPGFPVCSVEGHAGRLVIADRPGCCVAMLQGRAHRYEGLSLEAVARPVAVLARVGVKILIVTCAAGSLDGAEAGTLMLIEDHINLMGDSPLTGGGRGGFGSSGFVEMAQAYDPGLLEIAEGVAKASGLSVKRGVLAAVAGPSYETAAEAEMLRRLGAQAVSMSVVPEVIVARACRLRVLGLAVITNRAGMVGPELAGRSGHRQVVETAEELAAPVADLLDGIVNRLALGAGPH